MTSKILVTGIEGFTGRYIEAAFRSAGYQLIGLTNSDLPKDNWLQCDLRDKSALRELIAKVSPDAVLHLAGIASPTHEDEAEFYDSNTVGTVNLLESLVANPRGCNKVVIASSSNVYGSQAGRLDETQTFQPRGHYANSKVAMELMARNYFDRLPIVIARPFNYTGVGQTDKFVVPKIVDHFRKRAAQIELGNIEVERDFLDVRDTVAAYLSILESDVSSTELNICSGKAVSLKNIISMLSEFSQHKIKIEVNPEFVRSNDIQIITGDPTRLNDLTGFEPKFQIEETLDWMLNA